MRADASPMIQCASVAELRPVKLSPLLQRAASESDLPRRTRRPSPLPGDRLESRTTPAARPKQAPARGRARNTLSRVSIDLGDALISIPRASAASAPGAGAEVTLTPAQHTALEPLAASLGRLTPTASLPLLPAAREAHSAALHAVAPVRHAHPAQLAAESPRMAALLQRPGMAQAAMALHQHQPLPRASASAAHGRQAAHRAAQRDAAEVQQAVARVIRSVKAGKAASKIAAWYRGSRLHTAFRHTWQRRQHRLQSTLLAWRALAAAGRLRRRRLLGTVWGAWAAEARDTLVTRTAVADLFMHTLRSGHVSSLLYHILFSAKGRAVVAQSSLRRMSSLRLQGLATAEEEAAASQQRQASLGPLLEEYWEEDGDVPALGVARPAPLVGAVRVTSWGEDSASSSDSQGPPSSPPHNLTGAQRLWYRAQRASSPQEGGVPRRSIPEPSPSAPSAKPPATSLLSTGYFARFAGQLEQKLMLFETRLQLRRIKDAQGIRQRLAARARAAHAAGAATDLSVLEEAEASAVAADTSAHLKRSHVEYMLGQLDSIMRAELQQRVLRALGSHVAATKARRREACRRLVAAVNDGARGTLASMTGRMWGVHMCRPCMHRWHVWARYCTWARAGALHSLSFAVPVPLDMAPLLRLFAHHMPAVTMADATTVVAPASATSRRPPALVRAASFCTDSRSPGGATSLVRHASFTAAASIQDRIEARGKASLVDIAIVHSAFGRWRDAVWRAATDRMHTKLASLRWRRSTRKKMFLAWKRRMEDRVPRAFLQKRVFLAWRQATHKRQRLRAAHSAAQALVQRNTAKYVLRAWNTEALHALALRAAGLLRLHGPAWRQVARRRAIASEAHAALFDGASGELQWGATSTCRVLQAATVCIPSVHGAGAQDGSDHSDGDSAGTPPPSGRQLASVLEAPERLRSVLRCWEQEGTFGHSAQCLGSLPAWVRAPPTPTPTLTTQLRPASACFPVRMRPHQAAWMVASEMAGPTVGWNLACKLRVFCSWRHATRGRRQWAAFLFLYRQSIRQHTLRKCWNALRSAARRGRMPRQASAPAGHEASFPPRADPYIPTWPACDVAWYTQRLSEVVAARDSPAPHVWASLLPPRHKHRMACWAVDARSGCRAAARSVCPDVLAGQAWAADDPSSVQTGEQAPQQARVPLGGSMRPPPDGRPSEAVRSLITRCAPPHESPLLTQSYVTPLHQAAYLSDVAGVRALLQRSDLHSMLLAQDSQGNTPLHAAVSVYDPRGERIVRLLLPFRPPLSALNSEGLTPAEAAVTPRVVRLLRAHTTRLCQGAFTAAEFNAYVQASNTQNSWVSSRHLWRLLVVWLRTLRQHQATQRAVLELQPEHGRAAQLSTLLELREQADMASAHFHAAVQGSSGLSLAHGADLERVSAARRRVLAAVRQRAIAIRHMQLSSACVQHRRGKLMQALATLQAAKAQVGMLQSDVGEVLRGAAAVAHWRRCVLLQTQAAAARASQYLPSALHTRSAGSHKARGEAQVADGVRGVSRSGPSGATWRDPADISTAAAASQAFMGSRPGSQQLPISGRLALWLVAVDSVAGFQPHAATELLALPPTAAMRGPACDTAAGEETTPPSPLLAMLPASDLTCTADLPKLSATVTRFAHVALQQHGYAVATPATVSRPSVLLCQVTGSRSPPPHCPFPIATANASPALRTWLGEFVPAATASSEQVADARVMAGAEPDLSLAVLHESLKLSHPHLSSMPAVPPHLQHAVQTLLRAGLPAAHLVDPLGELLLARHPTCVLPRARPTRGRSFFGMPALDDAVQTPGLLVGKAAQRQTALRAAFLHLTQVTLPWLHRFAGESPSISMPLRTLAALAGQEGEELPPPLKLILEAVPTPTDAAQAAARRAEALAAAGRLATLCHRMHAALPRLAGRLGLPSPTPPPRPLPPVPELLQSLRPRQVCLDGMAGEERAASSSAGLPTPLPTPLSTLASGHQTPGLPPASAEEAALLACVFDVLQHEPWDTQAKSAKH